MANKRILVVDDEENIGRSLRLILEREGYTVSLASSIAEAAIVLNNEPQINSYVDFSLMANLAAAMLKEALDAFTAEDADASREIIRRDRMIDDHYHRVFDELIQLMIKRPETANGAARLLFVAKHLERIGDYVKDICELNVYLREAVFIKHSDKF